MSRYGRTLASLEETERYLKQLIVDLLARFARFNNFVGAEIGSIYRSTVECYVMSARANELKRYFIDQQFICKKRNLKLGLESHGSRIFLTLEPAS